MLRDPLLLTLAGLWLASVSAFLTGVLPYPIGFIILTLLIVARILDRRCRRR